MTMIDTIVDATEQKEARRLKWNAYMLAWYHKNKDRVNSSRRQKDAAKDPFQKGMARRAADVRSAKKRRAKVRLILNGLKNVPCADCNGRFPPECMDFDHVRGEKRFDVGKTMSRSMASIMLEVSKCDVICANCHRVRTLRQNQHGRGRPSRYEGVV